MNWLNKKVTESPYKLAIIGGMLIATVVSLFYATLQSATSAGDSTNLEFVDKLLNGPMGYAFIFLFAIVIISPLMEELIFRKFLWWISSMMFSPKTTLFIISFLFVAIHGEIAYAIALLPISVFLGWLRMKTGSIKPSIVAHIANNAAASVFFYL